VQALPLIAPLEIAQPISMPVLNPAVADVQTPTQKPELDPERPMVALTFDDGPSQYTEHILDLLEQHGGRASFVVVGNLVNSRRDTIARAASLGNEIIGHSWNHADLTKLSAQQVSAQLNDTSKVIASVTGEYPVLFRPPYGSYNSTVTAVAKDMGFSIIYWSVDTLDWKYRDSERLVNVIMNDVSDGAIILMHDIHATTAGAMDRVIPRLIAEGYQLVSVSELLQHRYGELQPGVVYYAANYYS